MTTSGHPVHKTAKGYLYQRQVRPDEIDELGHANNVAIVAWLQEAAVAHSAAQGWTTEDYLKLGAGWVVRMHTVEYLRPALQEENLVIDTWVASLEKATSIRRYEIRRADGKVLVAASTRWVFVNFSNLRPQRVPPEVAGAFPIVPDGPADPQDAA